MTTKTATGTKRASSSIKGSALVADLGKAPGVEKSYAYWCGALQGCPSEAIECGGINFPKMTQLVMGQGQLTQRVPMVGAIKRLSESKLRLIAEQLPLRRIRFRAAPAAPQKWDRSKKEMVDGEYDGTLTDLEYVRREGRLVRIPSKAQVDDAIKKNRKPPSYVAGDFDEPAARYMFCVLCENQKNPATGLAYPESLEVTGLQWPDEAEE